jgi:hypothetical protein
MISFFMKKCEHCGEGFRSTTETTKYCSRKCKAEAIYNKIHKIDKADNKQ